MKSGAPRADLDTIVGIIPEKSKVLDLGCGDGDLLVRLAKEKKVVGRGIELSEVGVRQCVSRGLSVRQGNIDEGLSDYPDASFDFVILSQTLPYVDDPKTVLCEMSRVGRQAIVSFPNLGYWRARLRLLLNGQLPESAFSPLSWYEAPRARPISIAGFLSLCNEAGITVATQIYLNGTGKLSAAKYRSLWATTGLFVLEGCRSRS